MMKISRILLAGLTGAALYYAVKQALRTKAIATAVNDIFFDSEFIPGTGKINQFVTDNPEMTNWFRTRQSAVQHEADETLFI